MKLTTMADLFNLGSRRGMRATSRLITAYRNVFGELCESEDRDLVMADLAEFTGFYMTMPVDATADAMQRAEGRREVFARILSLLGVSGEEHELLRKAGEVERNISAEEGSR